MMKRPLCPLFAGSISLLMTCSMALAQAPDASEFWKKYGGMPPLDIRVSIDGHLAVGLFEAALARKQGHPRIALKDRMIPVVVGQTVTFKVEVSPRGANQWTDVTGHKNLSI